MACSTGSTIYYNIRELPEIFSIENGNLLLLETDTGTNILDYENFIIDLDHTTFGDTITQHTTDIGDLSAKSADWDSTSTTVKAYSAAWLEQGGGGGSGGIVPTSPSTSYTYTKATRQFTGTAVAKDTAPVDITGLVATLSCAYPGSYVRVDAGVTHFITSAGVSPSFTLLSAVTPSGPWGEMMSFVKTDTTFNSLYGIWCGTESPSVENATINGTTIMWKPGLSAVSVKVAFRLQASKKIIINSSNSTNGSSTDDPNGISYIMLTEVVDNGYTRVICGD